MDNNETPAYKGLLILSKLFALGAVLTLVPIPWASWPNILGYKSLCTFAPAATALCALLAGITCTVRSRVFSARKAQHRQRPWFIPALVFSILLAVALPSGLTWWGYKSADTGTAASE